MQITPRQINDYCEAHSSPMSELLYRLERETNLKTLAPQMISGPLQGQLLRFLSLMIRPEKVLEIGSFTGYGTLCLSAGLQPSGQLITIEGNPELHYLIEKYVAEAGLKEQVQLLKGDAKEWIDKIEGPFDLIFVDAGKQDYPFYYEKCLPLLRQGGWLLADNVLWSGKVATDISDADTNLLREFNTMVLNDARVENLLLPLRDGLLIARKV